ncbi:hypothetical protein L1987_11073 [Smallanthus sonchifolius]|uniref:Uncharacterized protein n=1 Tax=Smallanthus sonchifolius TaxID=185202 RepID=A0ACB9J9X1_9ASTR|nr:hypothetical protein L1987_11073 [Smallanthus sonchifolius]
MDTALKSYAREGRLPVLGSNVDELVLYCPIAGTEALNPLEAIGSFGVRNFMMSKKPQGVEDIGDGKQVMVGKNSGSWKSWFNKSLDLKVG